MTVAGGQNHWQARVAALDLMTELSSPLMPGITQSENTTCELTALGRAAEALIAFAAPDGLGRARSWSSWVRERPDLHIVLHHQDPVSLPVL
jgi:hypothetical protein